MENFKCEQFVGFPYHFSKVAPDTPHIILEFLREFPSANDLLGFLTRMIVLRQIPYYLYYLLERLAVRLAVMGAGVGGFF